MCFPQKSKREAANFDAEFTKEEPVLTPVPADVLRTINQVRAPTPLLDLSTLPISKDRLRHSNVFIFIKIVIVAPFSNMILLKFHQSNRNVSPILIINRETRTPHIHFLASLVPFLTRFHFSNLDEH
jgi:hypothetical protein